MNRAAEPRTLGVSIGAAPDRGFDDPLGLMSDCHRRVERFLGMLASLGESAGDAPLTPEHRRALEASLRYFREASPRHTADEEQSLFPRLRRLDCPGVDAALRALEALEADHAAATTMHAEMERLGTDWLAAGAIAAPARERFRRLAAALREIYVGHIDVEERVVFPAARRALRDAELARIGEEMAARRGIPLRP